MPADTAANSPSGSLRLAELLGPLSLVTDMGMGAPDESAMRTCLLATGLARRLNLPEATVASVYYTTLLKHLGCTATAHDEALRFGGDELVMRPLISATDFASPRAMLSTLSRAGAGYRPAKRAGVVFRMATSARWGRGIESAICEVASMLAARLGMPAEVQEAVSQTFERWDGRGNRGLRGEDIALPTRFALVADRAVACHALAGPDAAVEAVQQGAGGWFDPEVAAAFAEHGETLLSELEAVDPSIAVLEAEPAPHAIVPRTSLDNVARVFADMTDLKSPHTAGHSPGVAELAEPAARALRCSPGEAIAVRHAALLHDLGRVAIPAGIWDRPGPLTTAERERMQMHPYYTERVLSRVPALTSLATVAGMHHERLDGSGYHRGANARDLPMQARILAAADAYRTMVESRPHRSAMPPGEAAETLLSGATRGLFDVDVARAVAEAAGQHVAPRRMELPAGLSERELEVLRLLCGGLSNREIAEELVISRRTAEHHVQNIYTRIGVSTRAGACVFAMQHDLLPPAGGAPANR